MMAATIQPFPDWFLASSLMDVLTGVAQPAMAAVRRGSGGQPR